MTVGDLPRAVAFYRDVLGMRFLFEAPPAMAFFDCGGVRLMLSLPEQAGAVGRPAVRVDHLLHGATTSRQAAAALGARGVAFEQPPHVVARLPHADLWMAFLRDPDGHLLAIMSEVGTLAEASHSAGSQRVSVSATRSFRPKLSCASAWTQRKPACWYSRRAASRSLCVQSVSLR